MSVWVLLAMLLIGQKPDGCNYWYASPDEFSLPPEVRNRLVKQGCVIPQSGALGPLENVVSGFFVTTKRLDYAALCSDRKASDVLVIHGVTGEVIARLNRQRDSEHLMPMGEYSGSVLFVREVGLAYADTQPFCLDEMDTCPCRTEGLDGIVDVYEKWSETHCWEKDWHTVTSGD